MKCVGSTLKLWLQFVNALLAIIGMALFGCAIYFLSTALAPFSYCVLALSLYILLVGIIGLYSIGGHRNWLLVVYTILYTFFVLVELVFLLLALFSTSTLQDIGDNLEMNKYSSLEKVKGDTDKNQIAFQIGFSIFVAIQVVSVLILLGCQSKLVMSERERWEAVGEEDENTIYHSKRNDQPLLTSSKGTPVTDSHRARLNDKYGGIFGKKQDIEIT